MEKLTFNDIRDNGFLLYEYKRGSHAYGLNTETSDEDFGGIYIAPSEQLLGLGLDYQSQVNNETNDIVWYELNKFMKLLLTANPTVLESLFVTDDCVLYEDPLMTLIKKHRDKFITKQCFNSFGGYASSQIKKARGLNKKIVNPVTKRLEPLDFCYTFYNQGSTKINNWLEYRGLKQKYCGLVSIPNMHDVYGLYYDFGMHIKEEGITLYDYKYSYYSFNNDNSKNNEWQKLLRYLYQDLHILHGTLEEDYKHICNMVYGYKGIIGEDHLSNELRMSSVSKGDNPICYISYNKNGYTKHCVDYKNYKDWEKHRNPVRYESNLNKNYDSKNIMHCMRLVNMCIEIANGNGFNVDRRNIDREYLLDIKNHKFEYDEIMSDLIKKEEEMHEAIKNSKIPEKIDEEFVNNLLLEIRDRFDNASEYEEIELIKKLDR